MSLFDRIFVASQYVTPQHALSRAAGSLADCKRSAIKNAFIKWFIDRYGVNMDEALKGSAEDYENFNDFFTRELKEGVRPIQGGAKKLVSPVDGCVSQSGRIEYGRIFQAKGHSFSLIELLGGDLQRAQPFIGGDFATIYLSPKDYHRIHMPIAGELQQMVYIPGDLFSVNPVTADSVPRLFARNERVVCLFSTAFGPMAMTLVGAMIVASVETVWAGRIQGHGKTIRNFSYNPGEVKLAQGEEMGRFHLGSTVVLTFPENAMQWNSAVTAEATLRLGQQIGDITAG
ncbi:archaetidylserine decarboxylase [Hahella ganghwensis]|uniref:archaetidylserine decarboxylase n=1 Tax=Hahella ganghwensis TaxID=286420 RepID=UPI000373EC0D|nr:archaetidylserine decarboxylase [Hahella ganghwensis]